jgi:hypothetical protein
MKVLKKIQLEKKGSTEIHREQQDQIVMTALQQKRDHLRHSISEENKHVKYLIENLREIKQTVDLLKAK